MLARMAHVLAQKVIVQVPSGSKLVILDVDATDDLCHGQRQLQSDPLPFTLPLLEIYDISANQWEGINYKVVETEDRLSSNTGSPYWCIIPSPAAMDTPNGVAGCP